MAEDKLPLYRDPETGVSISTHSMIKTFRRCPKQAYYKYVERLKPQMLGKPLRRGTWIHSLLETYYKGEDWEAEHAKQCRKFSELFDEEKDALGDLPNEMMRLMKSYLWHYKGEAWKVHEIEFTLEAAFPDGALYRGKIDMLIEDQYGLWIVDHKSHARLPDLTYRMLDAQSALYVWAAWKNKIPVQGHIWNYIRTKAPTTPRQLKAGGISQAKNIDTDFPTYLAALRKYGLDPQAPEHRRKLIQLKKDRYQPGEMQTSSFFRRDTLEKSKSTLLQVASDAYTIHQRMHDYPFDNPRRVERAPDRSCNFSCSYTDLCSVELFGGNGDAIRRSRFKVGDPMDYYYDNESLEERKADRD